MAVRRQHRRDHAGHRTTLFARRRGCSACIGHTLGPLTPFLPSACTVVPRHCTWKTGSRRDPTSAWDAVTRVCGMGHIQATFPRTRRWSTRHTACECTELDCMLYTPRTLRLSFSSQVLQCTGDCGHMWLLCDKHDRRRASARAPRTAQRCTRQRQARTRGRMWLWARPARRRTPGNRC